MSSLSSTLSSGILLRAAILLVATGTSLVLALLTLSPASAEQPVSDTQLPTLAEPTATTAAPGAELLIAPLVAGIVIVLAATALIISATKRRSAD